MIYNNNNNNNNNNNIDTQRRNGLPDTRSEWSVLLQVDFVPIHISCHHHRRHHHHDDDDDHHHHDHDDQDDDDHHYISAGAREPGGASEASRHFRPGLFLIKISGLFFNRNIG